MPKKLFLVAMGTIVVLLTGIQTATAQWYDNGVPAVGNPTMNVTGTFALTSPNGGTHCASTDASIQLTGGTTTADLTSLVATNIATCEVSGGKVFLCGGTTTVKSWTLTAGATIHSNGDDVVVTGISLHEACHNGLQLTYSSKAGLPLTGIFDNKTKASTLTLTGTLASPLGDVSATAHWTDHAPTYGIIS